METDQLDLLLVDARHMLWRAASVFFDLQAEDKDGNKRDTGGIYGWLRITMSTRFRFGGMVLACWDLAQGPSERRKLYPEYKNKPKSPPSRRPARPKPESSGEADDYNRGKAVPQQELSREEMLATMAEQEVTLKRILTMLGVRQASSPGWEADDVIATLCKRYKDANIGVLSGDRDLLQLVDDHVTVIRPQPKGTFEVFTPKNVHEAFGVPADRILDLKALAGDASDNIPGAKGIGPKTAAKLIQEHNTWQQALNWAANNSTSTLAQKLLSSADMVDLSAQLVRLNSQAPLDIIDPALNAKSALIEIAGLKFNSLIADGRKEMLLAMGRG